MKPGAVNNKFVILPNFFTRPPGVWWFSRIRYNDLPFCPRHDMGGEDFSSPHSDSMGIVQEPKIVAGQEAAVAALVCAARAAAISAAYLGRSSSGIS